MVCVLLLNKGVVVMNVIFDKSINEIIDNEFMTKDVSDD